MAVRTREDYENVLAAVGACLSVRVPVLVWGPPGSGKTSAIESAVELGWHVETLIISHYEPSDLAGLPLLKDDHVLLAPPGWAKRVSEVEGDAIVFFDEFSTASPALQAAALRPLTHFVVGDLQLPDTVAFAAAANPADIAASGWELALPTANRFCHMDWDLPLEVYSECLVSGAWPTIPVGTLPEGYQQVLDEQRAKIAGFLRARSSQLSVIPENAAERGRAYPSPRSWDYAGRLLAYAIATGANEQVARLLVAGCVGDLVAHEFLAFAKLHDLPDPEDVLDGYYIFAGTKPDRTYVILQAVLAAVQRDPAPERWTAAVEACSRAAAEVGIDPAVPVVRALLRPGVRPAGAALPASIKVFAPVLALAGLLPGA